MNKVKIRNWWEEAIEITNIFTGDRLIFIIYKGFKITRFNDNTYVLEDVRLNDFYTEVRMSDLDRFNNLGFVRGADLIRHTRDLFRYNLALKHLVKHHDLRERHESGVIKPERGRDKAFHEKGRGNASKNIDMVFFYQSRIGQFKNS